MPREAGSQPVSEASESRDPSAAPVQPASPATTGVVKAVLVSFGVAFTLLGLVGAFLPVLPTTPFMLLAGACFVRSSPSLHRRLLANRAFGPYLHQWQRDHSIPREAKRKAYGLVVLSFALSIAVVEALWLRGLLAVVGLALLAFLAWLPTTTREEPGS